MSAALLWGRKRLVPSPSASLDAQLLLASVLDCSRATIVARGEMEVGGLQSARYVDLIERRAAGEPVAYLLGRRDWGGMELSVTPDVLIPRPETELLVDLAVEVMRRHGARSVADIGTGAGGIAIELARRLPQIRVWATDVSDAALAVAVRNVGMMGVDGRIEFLQGDLLEPLTQPPDVMVANLPYLSQEMMEQLDRDVRYEPPSALFGGPNGLEIYRRLFRQMRDRRWTIPAVVEIDPRQSSVIKRDILSIWPGARVEIARDYAGLDRIVLIEP